MNIPLLLKVKAHILAEPEFFDMGHWYSLGSIFEVGSRTAKLPSCGTTCCIGGTAAAIHNAATGDTVSYARGEIPLGLTESQATNLFYKMCWPESFRVAYDNATGQKERAEIAADYIDYFIHQNVQSR